MDKNTEKQIQIVTAAVTQALETEARQKKEIENIIETKGQHWLLGLIKKIAEDVFKGMPFSSTITYVIESVFNWFANRNNSNKLTQAQIKALSAQESKKKDRCF